MRHHHLSMIALSVARTVRNRVVDTVRATTQYYYSIGFLLFSMFSNGFYVYSTALATVTYISLRRDAADWLRARSPEFVSQNLCVDVTIFFYVLCRISHISSAFKWCY